MKLRRMSRTAFLTACFIVLPFLLSPALLAQQWTRFRGPNGSGLSDATTVPTKWTARDYNWKIDIPGVGHSSPVVWQDKVIVTSGDEKTGSLHVLCVRSKDGNILWNKEIPSSRYRKHAQSSFASSTPAVDADHIYITWATPEQYSVAALDHRGEFVWQLDLGPWYNQHGFGGSPIVYQESVILCNDQNVEKGGQSFLMAVDRKSGKTLWKVNRKGRRCAYATPCVYQPEGGQPELIFCSGANGITSLDPATGKKIWEYSGFNKRNVSSPVIAGGLIFGACGSGGGGNYVLAVKPGDRQGKPAELVYKFDKSAPYVPTSVAYRDMLFLWSDRGIVTCLDTVSGKEHWKNRIGGNYSGSPICVNGYLYCISSDGTCVVLKADKKFELVAKNALGDNSRATPSVADGVMYLRTHSSLASLGGK